MSSSAFGARAVRMNVLVASDRNDERLAAPGDLELVRDFVNTLDILPGTERFGDPVSLALWLADHRLLPPPLCLQKRISCVPEVFAKRYARSCWPTQVSRSLLRPRRRLKTLPAPHDCAPGSTRKDGWSCSRPTRTGWVMPSAAWSLLCSRRSRMGPGPASRFAPNATGRSTTTPRTIRPPGAAPSAERGSALAATGDDAAKSPRSVSPPPRPTSENATVSPTLVDKIHRPAAEGNLLLGCLR